MKIGTRLLQATFVTCLSLPGLLLSAAPAQAALFKINYVKINITSYGPSAGLGGIPALGGLPLNFAAIPGVPAGLFPNMNALYPGVYGPPFFAGFPGAYPPAGLGGIPALGGLPLNFAAIPGVPAGLFPNLNAFYPGVYGPSPFGIPGLFPPVGFGGISPVGFGGISPVGFGGISPVGLAGISPVGLAGISPVGIGGYPPPVGIGGFPPPVGIGGYPTPVGIGGYPPPMGIGGYPPPVGIGGYPTPGFPSMPYY